MRVRTSGCLYWAGGTIVLLVAVAQAAANWAAGHPGRAMGLSITLVALLLLNVVLFLIRNIIRDPDSGAAGKSGTRP